MNAIAKSPSPTVSDAAALLAIRAVERSVAGQAEWVERNLREGHVDLAEKAADLLAKQEIQLPELRQLLPERPGPQDQNASARDTRWLLVEAFESLAVAAYRNGQRAQRYWDRAQSEREALPAFSFVTTDTEALRKEIQSDPQLREQLRAVVAKITELEPGALNARKSVAVAMSSGLLVVLALAGVVLVGL